MAFSAPQHGWFNPPGLLRGAVVRAHSESRVTRLVRGERLVSSTCRVSGSATAGVVMRRSAGQSGAMALSSVEVCEGSFDRPVQQANGADAPDGLVRSCHRGARLICNVRRMQEENSNHFALGVFAAFRCSSRRPAASRGEGEYARPGSVGRFDLGRGNEKNGASGYCGHRGHLDQVGVRQRGNGLSRTAARLSQPSWRTLGLHAFDERSGLDAVTRFDRRAGSHRHRARRSVAVAPLCGLFATASHSRTFCPARAHSRVRLTARWSRRAHRPVRSCHRGARLSASVIRS